MTALKQYERLESTGLWRPSEDQQRREVTIFFGDATLVIADGMGRPLTHWSLAALERQNPGVRPAIYTPGPDASEVLEIEEAIMIDAIEKVRRSIRRVGARPGRLRGIVVALMAVAIIGLAVFWAPGAIRTETLRVVPVSKRAEIGSALFDEMRPLTGSACSSDVANEALNRLRLRVLGADSRTRIVVVRAGVRTVLALPGGILLINPSLVEDYEDPAVLAGFLLEGLAHASAEDPLGKLLEHAGLITTLTLLTSGDLPRSALRSFAEEILTLDVPRPDTDLLLALFDSARVPTGPYAYALDVTGETTLDLIESSPQSTVGAAPILSDRDWVALQGICGG